MVRAHWLLVPLLRSNLGGLVLLGFGVIVSYVLAYLGVLLALTALLHPSFDDTPSWVFIVTLILAALGPVVWIVMLHAYRHDRAFGAGTLRTQRLFRLHAHRGVPGRLPHRQLEHAFRARYRLAKKLRQALRLTPPNHLIVLCEPRYRPERRPTAAATPFEPIEVAEESETMNWLAALHDTPPPLEDNPPSDGAAGPFLKSWRDWIPGLMYAACAAWFLVNAIRRAIKGDVALFGFVFLGILLPLIARLLVERRWWVAPGALLYRESVFWRKGVRIKRFTPDDTPLLLDWRSSQGYVLDGRRVLTFTCGDAARWVIAAAWMSQARRPTLAEAESLLAG